MAVVVEMHNTGDLELQRDVAAMVEHVLADRPGEWQVSIIGSQGSNMRELKIFGPNAFERSYTLEGSGCEHGRSRYRRDCFEDGARQLC
jgi:hypothetical protein